MHPLEHLRGQVADPVDQGGRTWIGGACLAFLRICQRHRAQGEDLVDLGSVVEIAGALRRDLRMVVQDHRRREHEIVAGFRSGEHRPGAVVDARGDFGGGPFGWVHHGQEARARYRDEDVRSDQGLAQPVLAAAKRSGRSGAIRNPHPEPQRAVGAGHTLRP